MAANRLSGRAHADPRFRQREDDQAGSSEDASTASGNSSWLVMSPLRQQLHQLDAAQAEQHAGRREREGAPLQRAGYGRDASRSPAQQEGLAQHAQDIDRRQQAAGQHDHDDDPVAAVPAPPRSSATWRESPRTAAAPSSVMPARPKANMVTGRRSTAPARPATVSCPVALISTPAAANIAGFGQAVGECLHHAGLERGRGAASKRKDQEQVAELRHRRIGHQAFSVSRRESPARNPRRSPPRRASPAARRQRGQDGLRTAPARAAGSGRTRPSPPAPRAAPRPVPARRRAPAAARSGTGTARS